MAAQFVDNINSDTGRDMHVGQALLEHGVQVAIHIGFNRVINP